MTLKNGVIAAVMARRPVDERERMCIRCLGDDISRPGDDPFSEHWWSGAHDDVGV